MGTGTEAHKGHPCCQVARKAQHQSPGQDHSGRYKSLSRGRPPTPNPMDWDENAGQTEFKEAWEQGPISQSEDSAAQKYFSVQVFPDKVLLHGFPFKPGTSEAV